MFVPENVNFQLFIYVKRALNESWKLETAEQPTEFHTVIVNMLKIKIGYKQSLS